MLIFGGTPFAEGLYLKLKVAWCHQYYQQTCPFNHTKELFVYCICSEEMQLHPLPISLASRVETLPCTGTYGSMLIMPQLQM